MSEFFKNLKVIELASVLAGPSAGMFFAELGAKVLKIENKAAGGDATRGWRLPGESADGPSAYFCAVNYGKEHRFLDLRNPEERAELYREVGDADIVLSNYRADTAEKLGVDEAALRHIKPDLIFIQLDGFDASDRVAYDVVLQAETGWISMTGHPEGPVAKLPVALIDLLAGHQMKEAALLALLKKARSGEGSMVRVSLEKSSLAALANQATNYLMGAHVAQPMGTAHPNIAPYGDSFLSADAKRVLLAVGSDAQFAKLCQLLGAPEMAEQTQFASNAQRVIHRKALVGALQPLIAAMTVKDLEAALQREGVPYGVVRSLDEVLQSESAASMMLEAPLEGIMTKRLSGNAFSTDFLKI